MATTYHQGVIYLNISSKADVSRLDELENFIGVG
jgi:hypothetical protein